MESLLKYVQDNLIAKKDFPDFSTGDTITVYYEIKEGEKSRVQFFRGVVIQRRGTGATETFTIRKMFGEVCGTLLVAYVQVVEYGLVFEV